MTEYALMIDWEDGQPPEFVPAHNPEHATRMAETIYAGRCSWTVEREQSAWRYPAGRRGPHVHPGPAGGVPVTDQPTIKTRCVAQDRVTGTLAQYWYCDLRAGHAGDHKSIAPNVNSRSGFVVAHRWGGISNG